MAYPTTLSWKPTSPIIGLQPIASSSTTQNHPLGLIVRAKEIGLGLGEAEFIYLAGVASTAAGDAVVYSEYAGTTTRAVEASRGPLAVAMSANDATTKYGWYQISGAAIVATAASAAAGGQAYLSSTPGTFGVTPGETAGDKIERATYLTATDTPTAGFTAVQLSRPSADGAGAGPG